jgi:hypothetical protein
MRVCCGAVLPQPAMAGVHHQCPCPRYSPHHGQLAGQSADTVSAVLRQAARAARGAPLLSGSGWPVMPLVQELRVQGVTIRNYG